jgi:hypothetical protein
LDPEQSGIDQLRICDNSLEQSIPSLTMESQRGRIFSLAGDFRDGFSALGWTS